MNIGQIARRPFYDNFFLKPNMPGFLRLALSDSLSYHHGKGGAIDNFSDHHFSKLNINKGLKKFHKLVHEAHESGNHITNMLTIPDLIQIGGAAAVQYAGGPFIDVKYFFI